MQNVDFRSVDEFLTFLPDAELEIVEFLRQIIFNCIPDVREQLAYNVAYYKRYKNICFIWPASILWGKTKTYEGVRLGFVNGYLLQDEINYLDKGNRKQVYWKDFSDINEIDVELLKTYIYEAAFIDQEMGKSKIRKAP